MTTKTPKSKKAQIKNETPVETETPKTVELTAAQIALRKEVAKEVFGVEDYTTMTGVQKETFDKLVARLKPARVKKEKAPKIPKRTAGRLIAPTLRVKDENAILRAFYGMQSLLTKKTFKGGWGTTDPTVEMESLCEGLKDIIESRKIADDTNEIQIQ